MILISLIYKNEQYVKHVIRIFTQPQYQKKLKAPLTPLWCGQLSSVAAGHRGRRSRGFSFHSCHSKFNRAGGCLLGGGAGRFVNRCGLVTWISISHTQLFRGSVAIMSTLKDGEENTSKWKEDTLGTIGFPSQKPKDPRTAANVISRLFLM